MSFKKLIFFLILFTNLFTNFIANAKAELRFENKSPNTLFVKLEGWKRQYGLVYRLEDPRKVEAGKSIKWSPDIKPDIDQKILNVYDTSNKLVISIDMPRYKEHAESKEASSKKKAEPKEPAALKEYSVPKGFVRTITFLDKDLYNDTIEQTGKELSNFATIKTDFIEKSREFVIDSINLLFALQTKYDREKKHPLHPELYDIIHENPYAKKDAQVRVGGPIAGPGEQGVFDARQKVVKEAQEKFLGIKFKTSEKPLVIAFVASGGGQRALLCSVGSLVGADKIKLLDCGTYLATLSGSTWFPAAWMLSGLTLDQYEKRAIEEAKLNLLEGADVVVDYKRAYDQLKLKFAFAHPIGFPDLFGSMLARRYLSRPGKDGKVLGEGGNPQRCYLSSLVDGQNPDATESMNSGKSLIPIFTAVTAETGLDFWCWFTPWEFGSKWFGKSGAYVPMWAFGRHFEYSASTKNFVNKNWGTKENPLYGPRPTLGFLMGLWGSAPAAKMEAFYDQLFAGMKIGPVKKILEFVFKQTELKEEHALWVDVNNFMYKWPESLLSKYKYLKLADAGIADMVNPIFPVYRRPAQKNIKEGAAPDVIVIWDSSANASSVKELKTQSEYAKMHNHPFPVIDYDKLDKSVISIFTKNPNKVNFKDYEVPTVIFMSKMVDNDLLEKCLKDPDFKFKDIAQRLKGFDLNVCMKGTCGTFNFKYDAKTAQSLIDMAKFNTIASVDKIKDALKNRLVLNTLRDSVKTVAIPEKPLNRASA